MEDILGAVLSHISSPGAAGAAKFILFYAACCVAFLPISPLSFGAGALFGIGRGFLLVWIAATIGACLSFLIGRHWMRGWVERRIAGYPIFIAIDAAVSTQGWRVVLLSRLMPIPFTLLNCAYGLTRVKFLDYAWATCVGMIPGTLMIVYLGAAAGEAALVMKTAELRRSPVELAFFAVGLVSTIAVVTIVGRAAKRAMKAHVKLSQIKP